MTEGGMVDIFPTEWRLNAWDPKEWPGPLGLCLGLGAVLVGKVFLILYHYLQLHGTFGPQLPIQAKGAGQTPNFTRARLGCLPRWCCGAGVRPHPAPNTCDFKSPFAI
jgi:hypothetical protein